MEILLKEEAGLDAVILLDVKWTGLWKYPENWESMIFGVSVRMFPEDFGICVSGLSEEEPSLSWAGAVSSADGPDGIR